MDQQEQNQNQIPEAQQIPDTKSVHWLKYAEIVFVLLLVVNIGLFYFYLKGGKGASVKNQPEEVLSDEGFLLTKPDQTISRAGYTLVFSNPRHEYLEGQNSFRVDISLTNESFVPSIKVIANCDIAENGFVIKEGEGVSVESGESAEIIPGGSASWTGLVILDNANQKVVSCLYAPEGVFEPQQTIRVVF